MKKRKRGRPVTKGMKQGTDRAKKEGRKVEMRELKPKSI